MNISINDFNPQNMTKTRMQSAYIY